MPGNAIESSRRPTIPARRDGPEFIWGIPAHRTESPRGRNWHGERYGQNDQLVVPREDGVARLGMGRGALGLLLSLLGAPANARGMRSAL